jgi:hypothetical protein
MYLDSEHMVVPMPVVVLQGHVVTETDEREKLTDARDTRLIGVASGLTLVSFAFTSPTVS